MKSLVMVFCFVLSACGGSTPVNPEPVVIIQPLPVEKETLLIYDNGGDGSLDTIKHAINNGYEAMILNVTYSQVYRDSIADCVNCFSLVRSVIIGNDKNCADCFVLASAFDYLKPNMKTFLIINDELTLGFVEALITSKGYSDIVLVSSDEQLLINSSYNYELALIGETNNNNIDWHITENKDCSAKCVSPIGSSGFDGSIVSD